MSPCENNLFIKCHSDDQKNALLNIISGGICLFQSFIRLDGTKLETYGTESDVYSEYITVDIDTDLMISLLFHTHDLPPLEFCKKFAFNYIVNIQLVYYNEENNYSGELRIKDNRVCCNTIDSYYQGLYQFEQDRFWENIEESFQCYPSKTYEQYLSKINLRSDERDYKRLMDMFNKWSLFNCFQNL